MKLTYLWIDATAGASGDMLLAALLDAGASLTAVQESIDSLGCPEQISITVGPVLRGGLRATRAEVSVASEPTSGRSWREIRSLLDASPLRDDVKVLSLLAFSALADAEATVHGIPVDDVHFHEAGAWDSIADVVGVVAALTDLGIQDVGCSPIALGSGRTSTEHGQLPIPAPAVLELIKLAKARPAVRAGRGNHEACTPTAAALLTTAVDTWTDLPEMTISAVGIGAGARDFQTHANVVRAVIGERELFPAKRPEHSEITCNVDDLDPRIWPYLITELLRAGADDAWVEPIVMKKERHGASLHVLCSEQLVAPLSGRIFAETSTIGLRTRPVTKIALERRIETVEVGTGTVDVKIAVNGRGRVVNISAEYEHAVALARSTGRPLADVLKEAESTARARIHAGN